MLGSQLRFGKPHSLAKLGFDWERRNAFPMSTTKRSFKSTHIPKLELGNENKMGQAVHAPLS